jgi:cysteine desulfurase
MIRRVYLDANASTPIAPEVQRAMHPYLDDAFGNPSSKHWAGIPARQAVERARGQVAELLGCDAGEIVFTSGGSESSNAAIKGAYFAALLERGLRDAKIVTTAIEHPATLEACAFLSKLGAEIRVVPVDRFGRVDPSEIARAIDAKTILVTVMHANNEVGTIEPIREIAELARARGAWMHTDAAQSAGKISVAVGELGVDLMTIAGHKLYAPKGIGALYVRRGVRIEPLIHGGGHESGRRAGTESALLAVGLGAACALARRSLDAGDEARMRAIRDRLWSGLKARLGDRVQLNGHPEHRLPNTLNVGFVGRVGAEVLAAIEGVAASTGSACHEGAVELSPVLAAMGVPVEIGMGAVRFSIARTTTEEDIDEVLRRIA